MHSAADNKSRTAVKSRFVLMNISRYVLSLLNGIKSFFFQEAYLLRREIIIFDNALQYRSINHPIEQLERLYLTGTLLGAAKLSMKLLIEILIENAREPLLQFTLRSNYWDPQLFRACINLINHKGTDRSSLTYY